MATKPKERPKAAARPPAAARPAPPVATGGPEAQDPFKDWDTPPKPAPSPQSARTGPDDASSAIPAAGETPPPPAGPVEPSSVEITRTGDRLKAFVSRPYPVANINKPLASVEEAQELQSTFSKLKEALLTKEDYYLVKGPVPRLVPRRTGWRKLSFFMGISNDVVEERRWERNGVFGYDFLVVATGPNGQHAIGVGTCDSKELQQSGQGRILVTEHNARSKAHTRAVNRAVADLIGGGELSAEEVEVDE